MKKSLRKFALTSSASSRSTSFPRPPPENPKSFTTKCKSPSFGVFRARLRDSHRRRCAGRRGGSPERLRIFRDLKARSCMAKIGAPSPVGLSNLEIPVALPGAQEQMGERAPGRHTESMASDGLHDPSKSNRCGCSAATSTEASSSKHHLGHFIDFSLWSV